MKPLVGLLLVLSGLVLVAPPVYEVLSYIEYNNIPVVPVTLGAACVGIGLYSVWSGSTVFGLDLVP